MRPADFTGAVSAFGGALTNDSLAKAGRPAKQRQRSVERRGRVADRRQLGGHFVLGKQPLILVRATELPESEDDHRRDGRGDDDRGEDRHPPGHSTSRLSRARCLYSCARSQPLAKRRPPIVSAAATGIQTRCTHQGGSAAASRVSAATTTIAPMIRIRNAAGPSPTLKLS